MAIRPTTMAELKRIQVKIQKKRAANTAKRKYEEHIKQIVNEIYPKGSLMRDRNVSTSNFNESVNSITQGYLGKLDISESVLAPWGKYRQW